MWETWLRTVSTEIESSAATARFVLPRATDSSTASSRFVSRCSEGISAARGVAAEWVRT